MSEKSNAISREASLRRKKSASYHYRRKSKALFSDQYNPELKHVLGFTLKSRCAFTCDPNSGLIAYPAGCVIVLYNPRQDKQYHIFNPGQKALSCLHFSHDGQFITTGEAGHQPCVRVFSVAERCQLVSFSSHKFGISCVAFSPNGKYIVSIGYQHDNVINVWDWKKNTLAASNKVSTKIKSIAFASDGSYFVTVGNRLVKFWYLENPSSDKTTVPLKGRSAILETLRNHVFCDVVCDTGSDAKLTYAVTRSGILCQFNAGRTVEKYVEFKCGSARSVCILDDMILCGCASGSVHVYNLTSLEFITEVFPPQPQRGNAIVAMAIDMRNMWMHCIFSEHSLLVYDVMDFSNTHTNALFQFHNSCVWDVKVISSPTECNGLPADCFVTCSNDGTVRAWQCKDNQCNLLKTISLDGAAGNSNDAKYEARSLCVRYDAKHLAIGDRTGNIHVYSLESFERIAFIPTHEGDVLSMDYSQTGEMLASASRDRCVHTFDSSYNPTHTIADHSAAVTSVKFAQHNNDFRLITCGSDKSLYFCSITSSGSKTEIMREQHYVEKHSMSDMAVLDETVLVACGCNLSEYEIVNGKLKRSFKGNDNSVNILRVAVNYHRTLLANSCVDKHIYILGFATTECLCVLGGHSEVSVSLAFDMENRLLSASADSCIFIWVLNHQTSEEIRNLTVKNSASSAASTPDSPGLERLAYFADTHPVDVEATPRSLNGESLVGLFSESRSDEDLKTGATHSSFGITPQICDLPTWVTKKFQPSRQVAVTHSPRPAVSKWGSVCELEKVCEEIGNLAGKSSDVSSIRSSVADDESLLDDEENNTQSTSDAASVRNPEDNPLPVDTNDAEDSDDTVHEQEKHPPITDVEEALELGPASELSQSLSDVVTTSEVAEAKVEGITTPVQNSGEASPEEPMRGSGQQQQGTTTAKLGSGQETTVPNNTAEVATSEQHLQNADDSEKSSKISDPSSCLDQRSSFTEENDFEVSAQCDKNTDVEVSQICNTHQFEKPLVSESELQRLSSPSSLTNHQDRDMFDEDVDLRKVIYVSGENLQQNQRSVETSGIASSTENLSNPNESSVKSVAVAITPEKHFVSKTEFKITVSPALPLGVAEPHIHTLDFDLQQTNAPDEDIGLADETASSASSSDLVEKVTSDTNEKHAFVPECNNIKNKPDQTVTKEAYDINAVSEALQCDNKGLKVSVQNEKHHNAESSALPHDVIAIGSNNGVNSVVQEFILTSSTTHQSQSKEPSCDLRQTTEEEAVETRSSSSGQPAMPPAFMELLASLKKKQKVHIAAVKSKSERECNSESMKRSLFTSQCKNEMKETFTEGHSLSGVEPLPSNVTCPLSLNNNNNHHHHDNREDDDCDVEEYSMDVDCERTSEELVAVFDYAEELYHKHKARYKNSSSSNGSHSGFNKLVQALQTVKNRISLLKISSNSVHPEPEVQFPPRCDSLGNLSDDSPVVSLLREYSERLVGIVRAQNVEDNAPSLHTSDSLDCLK